MVPVRPNPRRPELPSTVCSPSWSAKAALVQLDPKAPHSTHTLQLSKIPNACSLQRGNSYTRPCLQYWERLLFCLIHRKKQENQNEYAHELKDKEMEITQLN